MSTPLLATKLYIPPLRPRAVRRPHLLARLEAGLPGKLTLISAPAGFGKSTLVSEWAATCDRPVAWLSLDADDSAPTRFLTYVVAAMQTVAPQLGAGLLGLLHSPQLPPMEALMTALLNDVATLPEPFVLVLDDYHVIDASPIDQALTFLVEHEPPQLHLVIATREDPPLPLARLRARGQLTELRAADLRFTLAEAAGFLNHGMDLGLSTGDVAALETRTEGWIAGLQLAAISMQSHPDPTAFVKSFTGSHHFVMDYLMAEVLQQQSASVQTFLLCTSILDRLCGPLCDAVLLTPPGTGQAILQYLEQANLFTVPLDSERRWYRYHHLFADLMRQRLLQGSIALPGYEANDVAAYHIRASQWFEENNLELEAFHYAAAANDVERAARLAEGGRMPLLFRGAVTPILNWLAALPTPVLDARPGLWVMYASALLFDSQLTGIEEKLQAAEAAIQALLQGAEPDEKMRDVIGHIASIRATLAVTQHDVASIITQSRRALAYLHPDNLPVRTATTWTLGHAYHLQGDHAAARRAYTEAITISEAIGHFIIAIMATMGLGNIQEADNQLDLAAETYRRVLHLAGDPPPPVACQAHLGLARIAYARNDLVAARQQVEQSIRLAQQLVGIDRIVAGEVFLARLTLAEGDAAGAAAILTKTEQFAREHNFVHQLPEIAAAQALIAQHSTPLEGDVPPHKRATNLPTLTAQSPSEPLSPRELEILQLIAEGLSNQEICDRLYLALDTVKGHNRRIFDKLQVQRRTEAVARARSLNLLPPHP